LSKRRINTRSSGINNEYISIYAEILSIYFTEYLTEKYRSEKGKPYILILIRNIFNSIIWLLRDIANPIRTFYLKRRVSELSPKEKIWLFISSKNQFDSIGFLNGNLKSSIIVVPHIRQLSFTDFIYASCRK